MVVVAAICPKRNCAAMVLVPRADARLNITNSRKRFKLTCPFCGAKFEVPPSDTKRENMSPRALLLWRYLMNCKVRLEIKKTLIRFDTHLDVIQFESAMHRLIDGHWIRKLGV